METLDYLVVAIYLAAIVLLGLYVQPRQPRASEPTS